MRAALDEIASVLAALFVIWLLVSLLASGILLTIAAVVTVLSVLVLFIRALKPDP